VVEIPARLEELQQPHFFFKKVGQLNMLTAAATDSVRNCDALFTEPRVL
jgi:hypothetical protein